MKLLLTSAGLSNKSITQALEELLAKSAQGAKLAFIPTAANIEPGEKSWLVDDLSNFKKAGFEIDIVDISAIPKENWLPRLQEVEVLCFGGGNTFHLMYWLKQSGLQAELPSLLKNRIYVGISAGSCVAGPSIANSIQDLFDEQYVIEIREGLGLVNFQFVPHLNSPHFDKIREKNLRAASQHIADPVYALDDNSALKVVNGKTEIISEGKYLALNL